MDSETKEAVVDNNEDENDEGEDNAFPTVERPIAKFKVIYDAHGAEGLIRKNSHFTLPSLKKIAKSYGMPISMSKPELEAAIAEKLVAADNLNKLNKMRSEAGPNFRRDKNAIPRLLNILTAYPEGMLLSKARPSWRELQNGITGS